MLSLTPTTALLIFAGAIVAGFLTAWVQFQLRTASQFVPLSRHREELVSLRRRYRRRLRAVREVMARHRLQEAQLRSELKNVLARGVEDAKLFEETRAAADALRARVAELETARADAERALRELRERECSLAAELQGALERLGAFERERALLRIERDELAARTQRLRVLPITDGPPPEQPTDPATSMVSATLRTEVADRDARIHELECALRESAARVSELEADLHRWKYRIAPLAWHLKLKRERDARAAGHGRPGVEGRGRGDDDLKRIRGIGRALEKKLRAAGVRHLAQIAAMSPAELATLAVRVGVAASRPSRDDWAGQAREHCGDRPLAGNG